MRSRILVAVAGLMLVPLAGCGGATADKPATAAQLAQLLDAAKTGIDNAKSIDFSISTKALPGDVTGLLSAAGTADHSPAFEGTASLSRTGSRIDAKVIAIGQHVWAALFGDHYLDVEPEQYGIPSLAKLIGTHGDGISAILTSTDNLAEGARTRDGEDIVRNVTGTIPGTAFHAFIPSARLTGTFDVTYRLTEAGTLINATVKGPFYGTKTATYSIRMTPKNMPAGITAPK